MSGAGCSCLEVKVQYLQRSSMPQFIRIQSRLPPSEKEHLNRKCANSQLVDVFIFCKVIISELCRQTIKYLLYSTLSKPMFHCNCLFLVLSNPNYEPNRKISTEIAAHLVFHQRARVFLSGLCHKFWIQPNDVLSLWCLLFLFWSYHLSCNRGFPRASHLVL